MSLIEPDFIKYLLFILYCNAYMFLFCKKMKPFKIILFLVISLLYFGNANISYAEGLKKVKNISDKEFNFYGGKFDFSDDGKRSNLFGIQHQNEELYRNSFLGKISPITGGFITAAGAAYLYTGVQAEYELGPLNFTPSFTPGYYTQGDGKDLGHVLEFKSEVQVSLNLFENSQFGMSYNHISNASLGDKNPGANSYMFNFLQKF